MKKFSFPLLALLAILEFSTSCNASSVKASKNYVTKEANVGPIKHITLNGSIDIFFKQSEQQHVEVYAPDNIIDLIEIRYDNGNLTAGFKKNTSVSYTGKVEVRISAPAPKSVTVNGSGDVNLLSPVITQRIAFNVKGSGDVKGTSVQASELTLEVHGSGDIGLKQIEVESLNAKVHGSGDIEFKGGNARQASFIVNGSGDIDAQHLMTEHVTANINGSGEIKCYATQKLSGSVSGSGDVRYKGNPEISFGNKKKGLSKL